MASAIAARAVLPLAFDEHQFRLAFNRQGHTLP